MAVKDVRAGITQQKVNEQAYGVVAVEAAIFAAAIGMPIPTVLVLVSLRSWSLLTLWGAISTNEKATQIASFIGWWCIWGAAGYFLVSGMHASPLTVWACAVFAGLIGMGFHLAAESGQ